MQFLHRLAGMSASDMRPMPAAHGPNAAFMPRPNGNQPARFQIRKAEAPTVTYDKPKDMTEDDENMERLLNMDRCIRCTKMFREEENSDDACQYHPGPCQTALRNQNHLDRITFLCCGGTQIGFSPVLYDVPACKVGRHISAEVKQKMIDARRAQRAAPPAAVAAAAAAGAAAAAPVKKVMGFGSSTSRPAAAPRAPRR